MTSVVLPVLWRPAARADMQREVAHYGREAGRATAAKLVTALRQAQERIAGQPGMGSPRIGQALGVEGLRSWRLGTFPLSLWYFNRADHIDVVRLVAHRQDIEGVSLDWV